LKFVTSSTHVVSARAGPLALTVSFQCRLRLMDSERVWKND
jgi:hypothetical protein